MTRMPICTGFEGRIPLPKSIPVFERGILRRIDSGPTLGLLAQELNRDEWPDEWNEPHECHLCRGPAKAVPLSHDSPGRNNGEYKANSFEDDKHYLDGRHVVECCLTTELSGRPR